MISKFYKLHQYHQLAVEIVSIILSRETMIIGKLNLIKLIGEQKFASI